MEANLKKRYWTVDRIMQLIIGVVLATGDFSGDRDMMRRYCPETADYVEDDVYDGEPDWDQGFKYGGIYKGQGQIAMAVNVGLGTAARLMRGSRDQNDVWARATGAFRMKRLAQPCFLSRKGAW